jgi:4-amino-4-deoxy-L-arabinose transferase-like glycosyltransferase
MINFVGALGPELAFDALWYHLTLPKLSLCNHTIYHIPGGLLYYSDMPKLGEMLYIASLALGNEVTAKIIHFAFGLLTACALFKFSRTFFSQKVSLIIMVIFYSNLVVAWESTTAYIDLIRTFFELLALQAFITWYQTRKQKWFFLSALMIGFEITTKLLGISSLIIMTFLSLLIALASFPSCHWKKICSSLFLYWLIAITIPSPWIIFSFINTGNPVYPFFTQIYSVTTNPINPFHFFVDSWHLFTRADDPVSPIYIILFPLLILSFFSFRKEVKVIVLYCFLSLLLWYLTPQTGGGRFILPSLPAFSLIAGALYDHMQQKKQQYLSHMLLITIIFIAFISIGYRGIANWKYIPVIFGRESTHDFLSHNLNYSFGDFFDTDNFFAHKIKKTDTVLLYGFHNLYYVNFSFVDSSWVQKGDAFTYIAVQNSTLPQRFHHWKLIYHNPQTLVQLYMPPQGECLKQCRY